MRTVYACNVPDLELFPEAWQAGSVRFHAGLELGVINGALTVLRALRQLRLIPAPQRLAPLALRLSLLLYGRGSKNGALAVWVRGPAKCANAEPGSGREEIEGKIALVTDDDGPATPSSPAILLARKLLVGEGRRARTMVAPSGLITRTQGGGHHRQPRGFAPSPRGAIGARCTGPPSSCSALAISKSLHMQPL